MRKLIVLSAAASLLAVAACNKPAETAPAAGAAATDAAATDAGAGMDASSSTGGSGASSSGSTSGAAAGETMNPQGDMTTTPTTGVGPVSEATRDGAKTAAEETNLHPKPPMN